MSQGAAVLGRHDEGRGEDREGEAGAGVGVHVLEGRPQAGGPDAQVVQPGRRQRAAVLLIQLRLVVWHHPSDRGFRVLGLLGF